MAYILKNGARPNGSEVRNIKVGDSEIKYIITGGGSLFYDIQHYIEYDIPELTFLYPDTVIPAEGGKLKPNVQEFKQKWRRVGYSGNKYEQEIIIEGADIQYHVLSGEDITVDEFGEIEWKSRGITFDENERTAVIQMTVIINGQENHTTATVRQAKNIIEKIDYSEPIGKNLTVLDIPAKGGMITSGVTDGTITQIQTDTYSSKEQNSYEINPDIMSDYYSDPVIADNLLSNITKRSIVGTLTYYYNCNGITGQCSADVYQQANIVESIEIRENSLQYDDIAAGDTLATPITSDAPRFYFTSEEYSDVIPSKQYGEFVEYISYQLDSYINGFVGCDYSTGQLYATSRGTEYGSDYRVSGTVNKLVTYNWYPISHEYGDFKEISGSTSASCKQEPNLIVELTLENLDAGYINQCDYFAASEETKVITNGSSASTQCLVTFSSNDNTYEYQNWVNINIDYDWVSDKDYVYITSFEESCQVTMESRGTDYDSNSRLATINRIANIEASLKSGYVYAPSVSDSVSCNVDIYQKPNNITITNITVNPGTIDNPGIYIAKGETKSINSSQASTAVGTLTFDSGDSVPASATYGLWKGPNYSWSSDKDYASCSSIGNFESINVTMDNRTIIEGPQRDATITRNVTWEYELKNSYGGGSDYKDSSTTVVIYQEANIADVRSEITEYGTPDISIDSTNLTAAGGYCTIYSSVTNIRTYYYTSESPGRTIEEPGEVGLLIDAQYFSTSSGATYGTKITRFDLNGVIISHDDMTTNDGYDFVTIRSVNKLSIDYYQLETASVQNQKDYSNKITTYGNVDFAIGDGLTAAGGEAPLTYSQVNTRTYYYTSGSISRTEDEYGEINISITRQTLSSTQNHGSTNISRFSINGDATFLLHQNMTNNITYDVVTVKATGEGGKSTSITTSVKNIANATNEITTYGEVIVTINGGLEAYESETTISCSQTNARTYYYTSGTISKTEQEPGSVILSIYQQTLSSNTSHSSTNISRYSLNGNALNHASMETTAGYDVITVVGYGTGSKVGYDTTYVRNIKDDYSQITTYNKPEISLINNNLSAAGGQATVSYSQTNIRTWYYTSGAISRTENVSGNVSIDISKQTLSSTTSHGSTNITRYSLNKTTDVLSHTSMTNKTTYDVVTIKATGEGSMTNTYTTYVKNVANASSAITEYGVPSVSIGSLYAYESETTVTYSAKNTKTYYYTSGTAGTTEQVAASVTAEMTTNGNNRFTFTDPGLKHASMGTSATTDKVVIKVTNDGDTSKTNTASKSITNYADAYYDYPVITKYTYATFPAEGGSKTPTVAFYQYSYYSSGEYCNTYTSGGTFYFKMPTTTGFTLNSTTTGKITTTANNSTSERSAAPQVKVTLNGYTSSYYTTTRCIQEGLAEEYKIDNIELWFSAAEDSESFTVTYSYYVGGSYVSSGVLSNYTITEISDSNSAFSRSGTTITAEANESTSSRSATYQISASGYDSGYIDCYQDGDSIYYSTIYLSSGFSKTSPCPAEGGSCTVTAKVTNYWVSGDVTYDIPTLRSNNSALTVTKVNRSTYKATATWSANTGTSERSTTITASYSGASSETATLYQEGSVSIVDEWLTISSFTYDKIPPDGGSVTPTIGTITYHVEYSDGSDDSWTISKDQCSFTYSLDSTTNFTINTAGKVSSKSVNNSGMTRSAEVTCICKWEGLSCEKQTTILQQSNYWYLYLVNASYENYQIALCISGYSPDMHATSTINVDATSTFEMDITTGLDISYTNGATRLANNNESVYVWKKGDREFTFIGSFTYYSKQDISFGINK